MIKRLKKLLIPLFLRTQKAENIFTRIYRRNSWGDAESVSGPGSSLAATHLLRTMLPRFFSTHNIRTLVDVPCGDFNWFRDIHQNLTQYTGYDIVKALVDSNASRFAGPGLRFIHANALEQRLVDADLILCRDFMIHLSYADIFRFFYNLRRSAITHILASQFSGSDNRDISTGDFRPIDLTATPFNFPAPREQIPDEGFGRSKTLAHWVLADIYAALDRNPHYLKLTQQAA